MGFVQQVIGRFGRNGKDDNPTSKAVNAPSSASVQSTTPITPVNQSQIIVPTDAGLRAILVGLGAEHVATATRAASVLHEYDIFTIPIGVTPMHDRESRQDEFTNGHTGIVPNALLAPDGTAIMAIQFGAKGVRTVVIGLAWRATSENLQKKSLDPSLTQEERRRLLLPLERVIPVSPSARSFELLASGITIVGSSLVDKSVRETFTKENGIHGVVPPAEDEKQLLVDLEIIEDTSVPFDVTLKWHELLHKVLDAQRVTLLEPHFEQNPVTSGATLKSPARG